jgi:hypothetical protein
MKKYLFLASLKSMKKGVGSGVGSGSIGQRDPDPHKNVTDPEHWSPQTYLYLGKFTDTEKLSN